MGVYNKDRVYDLARLRRITGDDRVFERNLLQLVIYDLDDSIDNLQFAWYRNDLVEIRKTTGLLKCLTAVTGLHELAEYLLLVDRQLHSGSFLNQSEELLTQILANWRSVRPALNQALSDYR
jgi:hypothetical protein